mmetsp:Transcript_16873/g.32979  ORF Transcript_16873/g.32979 Transcript_16873/m.32979 type:complete len:241 (-) Transcript_16873:37-759(-)
MIAIRKSIIMRMHIIRDKISKIKTYIKLKRKMIKYDSRSYDKKMKLFLLRQRLDIELYYIVIRSIIQDGIDRIQEIPELVKQRIQLATILYILFAIIKFLYDTEIIYFLIFRGIVTTIELALFFLIRHYLSIIKIILLEFSPCFNDIILFYNSESFLSNVVTDFFYVYNTISEFGLVYFMLICLHVYDSRILILQMIELIEPYFFQLKSFLSRGVNRICFYTLCSYVLEALFIVFFCNYE